MLRFLGRYKARIVGFLVLTLPLVSLWHHGKERSKETIYQHVLLRVTSPGQDVMANVIGTVRTVFADYVWLVGVQKDNRELRKQSEELRGIYLARKQLEKENARLRKLLAFKGERPDLETIAASVVAKDVSPFHRVLKIKLSVGTDHGIRRYQPVITQAGVVGHIEKLTGKYAEVKLAVDSGTRISVDVAGRDVKGTVAGSGDRNSYIASFVTMGSERSVKVRDVLITNGEDERFPKGLVVGYIGKQLPRPEDGGYRYEVIPAVPFATLEEVLVVTSQVERIPRMGDRR